MGEVESRAMATVVVVTVWPGDFAPTTPRSTLLSHAAAIAHGTRGREHQIASTLGKLLPHSAFLVQVGT